MTNRLPYENNRWWKEVCLIAKALVNPAFMQTPGLAHSHVPAMFRIGVVQENAGNVFISLPCWGSKACAAFEFDTLSGNTATKSMP